MAHNERHHVIYAPWLEVPIADPRNLECLHYADLQTGQDQVRQPYPASGDCPPLSSDG